MGKRIRQDNRGMSLVELIVVIAIMAVIGAGVGFGLNFAANQYVPSCAKNLKSIIESTRTYAMGKQNAYLVLTKTDAGIMAQVKVVNNDGTVVDYGNAKKVGNASLTVLVTVLDGEGSRLVELGDTEDSTIVIGFSRNNGRQLDDGSNGSKLVTKIQVTRGSRERMLKLDILTGKVSIE